MADVDAALAELVSRQEREGDKLLAIIYFVARGRKTFPQRDVRALAKAFGLFDPKTFARKLKALGILGGTVKARTLTPEGQALLREKFGPIVSADGQTEAGVVEANPVKANPVEDLAAEEPEAQAEPPAEPETVPAEAAPTEAAVTGVAAVEDHRDIREALADVYRSLTDW